MSVALETMICDKCEEKEADPRSLIRGLCDDCDWESVVIEQIS